MEVKTVSQSGIQQAVEEIIEHEFFGFDTETYGRKFTDRMFALSICTPKDVYYFNFYKGADHLGGSCTEQFQLDYTSLVELQPVFDKGTWCAHNAKFDINKLRREGLFVNANVHCTAVSERIIHNDLLSYKLEDIAPRYLYSKDTALKEYLDKHNLYETVMFMGTVQDKIPMFYRAPYEDLVRYAARDSMLAYEIGKAQLEKLNTTYQ